MRTHGWGGWIPASDTEAIERILDAAEDALEERGDSMRIADVARALDVSRQTIYNYFPGPSTLEEAVAERSGMRLLEKLANHLSGIVDPVDALVESLAYTLEWLPSDKPFQLVLAHDMRKTSTGITSPHAKQFGRALLEGLDVDWRAMGFTRRGIDDLVEYTLRILQSLMIDPGQPPRRGKKLRNYLRRWVGPVVAAEVARHSH